MAILLASLSAITFGIGDFFGGLSARRIAAVLTTLVVQGTGLVLVLGVCLLSRADPSATDLWYGASAGLAGAVGLVLFYWAMAQGPMTVVAPVSAVTSALVPISYGFLDGERPEVLAVVGILLALPAIVLISREPTPAEASASERAVEASTHLHVPPRLAGIGGLPVIVAGFAGIGFGVFFVLISRTGSDSGLWPIASARVSAVGLALLAVVIARPARPDRTGLGRAVVAGFADAIGNSLYLLAARQGMLTLVGVIGAMYPASTVVLARAVLREPLARHQAVGLLAACVAVMLIALA